MSYIGFVIGTVYPVSYTHLYLDDIDEQAQERFEGLVEQLKQAQGITEQLKTKNALEWIQRMNYIHTSAREFVEKEIIFA